MKGLTTLHSFNCNKILNKLKTNLESLLLKFYFITTYLHRNYLIGKKYLEQYLF